MYEKYVCTVTRVNKIRFLNKASLQYTIIDVGEKSSFRFMDRDEVMKFEKYYMDDFTNMEFF